MILCAECGKKNKDNATVCKHCGYNPTALRDAAMLNYHNANYTNVPYQQPNTPSCYYDSNGRAYNVKYDYVVTPVGQEPDNEENCEESDTQQVLLYPYNPTETQQTIPQTTDKQSNPMAWVGYIAAMFLDILAWPFCLLGLSTANKRGGAKKELCEGGMMFTLLRLVSALAIFLVWLGIYSFWPQFFDVYQPWKGGLAKVILFGWPIVIGSIFYQCAAEDSGLEAAGRGFFYFSIAVAVVGVFLLDAKILPIFS